tara:strand:- start:2451 stop:2594 length:144 start_codon:yes stop_codon:yes gene_type:complete
MTFLFYYFASCYLLFEMGVMTPIIAVAVFLVGAFINIIFHFSRLNKE